VEEKRRSQRSRALKGARVVLNDGKSTISCTVRSLSAAGALIEFGSITGLPEEFTLMFDDKRPPRRCVVKRRSGKSVAVTFA
jgi:hypothetical protein